MSHFYGKVSGQARTEATRRGSPKSGMEVTAASWQGAIHTRLYVGKDGKDRYVVELIPWHGSGIRKLLAEGEVGSAPYSMEGEKAHA